MTAKKLVIIGSSVFGLLLIGGAALAAQLQGKDKAVQPAVVEQRPVSKAELAKADGKSGHDCLVAVDGTVYRIEGFSQWSNGQHTSSRGEAYCGADMSEVITKSPHGKQVLDKLIKVGPLQG
jgi:predicted heme/steroid binding protein